MADAFDRLKLALTSTPLLALADFSIPFDLETDASGMAIGPLLSQQRDPLAYLISVGIFLRPCRGKPRTSARCSLLGLQSLNGDLLSLISF